MEINLRNTLSGHQNPVYAIAIDSDNKILYSAGNDKGIVEWDLDADVFKRVLCNVSASVYCLCLIPNSNLLLAGLRNGDLLVIEKGAEVSLKAKLSVEKGAIFTVQYLESKREILAIGEQGKVYVWSLDSFQLLYQFEVAKTTVRCSAVSLDNHCIALGDKDGLVYLYDADDYYLIAKQKVHEGGVSSLAFKGNKLLSGGRDAKLYKLEIPSLQVLDTVVPHMFTVYGIKVLNADLFCTVSRDKTIKIWNSDLKLQKNISRDKGMESHFLSINAVDFSAYQQLIATAGDDKVIKLWQLS